MGFFKKFGKKNSKQENENKNKVTDSNALSMDELSNVSGGWKERWNGRYATTKEEEEWEGPLKNLEDEYRHTFRPCKVDEKIDDYLASHPCPNGFRMVVL